MPPGIGVKAQELAGVRRADHPGPLRAGQDLGIAGESADPPWRQQGPHLGEVPVGDRLDSRYPQARLGEQRLDGPGGAAAARDHVLDDEGAGSAGGRALDERAAKCPGLRAHVG